MKLLERDPCFEDKGNEIMNSTPKDSWKHLAFHETNKTKNIWKWIVSLFHVPLYIGIFSTYFYENKSQNQMDIKDIWTLLFQNPSAKLTTSLKPNQIKLVLVQLDFLQVFFFQKVGIHFKKNKSEKL